MRKLRTLLVWASLPLFIAASRPQGYKVRLDAVEGAKATVTLYRSGDSIDRPSGNQVELFVDGETRILNIRGQEVKDEASRKTILAKGSVLLVESVQRDGKQTALSLQAVGG